MYHQYDEEMLREDVAFPLRLIDDMLYDNVNHFIADKVDEDIHYKIVGKYVVVEEVMDRFKLKPDGVILDTKYDVEVLFIEDWEEHVERKRNIAHYLINRLNAL